MTHPPTRTGRLAGRVALVTGAGEGIGRAIARLFALEGALVGVLDADPACAEATAAFIEDAGGRSKAITVDVADDMAVAHAVAAVVAELGPLRILVNNAGVWSADDGAVTEIAPEVWERTIAVNLTGVFHCCRHGIRALLEAGGGAVINVSSVVALRPDPVFDAYTASKGGVIALTRSIAQHYAPRGVRANVILPGAVETAMTRDAFERAEDRQRALRHTPIGRIGRPEDLARAALFLASEDADFITGAVLAVDGGWLVAE